MLRDPSRVLITGGTGFIGRHLVRALLDRFPSAEITVASRTAPGDDAMTAGPHRHAALDVADLDSVDSVMAGVDLVFHLAAFAAVPDILADPSAGYDTNVTGTFNVLEAARRRGVRRIIYASTGRVYGAARDTPVSEDAPLAPSEPYGAQKAAGELFCRSYAAAYGLETVVLRPFVVYGPGQRARPGSMAGVVPRFTAQIRAGEPLTVVGDGRQESDFVHVRDVAEALVAACAHPGAAGEAFNLGSGHPTSIGTLVQLIGRAAGVEPSITRLPAAADTVSLRPTVSKATERLGWRPAVGLEAGLREYVAWMREETA